MLDLIDRDLSEPRSRRSISNSPIDAGAKHRPRAFHVIDIENIIRNPRPTLNEVRQAKETYLAADHYRSGDLVVIACNHGAASAVAFGWPEARLILRSGKDGADLALLQALDEGDIPNRYSVTIVASGDGIFADAVSLLGRQGVEVTVIYPTDGISRRLEMAAFRHVRFEFEPDKDAPVTA
ncbi:MAG: NYN domain-containing protein [Solirubrobacterales bacterium]